jgi:hypothetical protein
VGFIEANMHRILSATVIALAISPCAALGQSEATRIAPTRGWLADLNTAKAEALRTGKPMMVVFRCDP